MILILAMSVGIDFGVTRASRSRISSREVAYRRISHSRWLSAITTTMMRTMQAWMAVRRCPMMPPETAHPTHTRLQHPMTRTIPTATPPSLGAGSSSRPPVSIRRMMALM